MTFLHNGVGERGCATPHYTRNILQSKLKVIEWNSVVVVELSNSFPGDENTGGSEYVGFLYFNHLMCLVACESFTAFSCRESFRVC